MLDRLFYTSLAVLLVAIIGGQSYQYGRLQGELDALKAQHRISQGLKGPTAPSEAAVATITTPVAAPHVDAAAERIAWSNAETLARLYFEQATADARRAMEAAAAFANRALEPSEPTVRSPQVRTSGPAGRRRRDDSPEVPTRVVVEHTGTAYANPCPPGEKLISSTCLPANSIIFGQASIPVRIVGASHRAFDQPTVNTSRPTDTNRPVERATPPPPAPPAPARPPRRTYSLVPEFKPERPADPRRTGPRPLPIP